MSCAFCEIPSIREREIARNELAWAFPTNIPIVPGHILVAPIRCVATVDEMTEGELRAVFGLREQIKKALTQVFGAQGFNYAWNERSRDEDYCWLDCDDVEISRQCRRKDKN